MPNTSALSCSSDILTPSDFFCMSLPVLSKRKCMTGEAVSHVSCNSHYHWCAENVCTAFNDDFAGTECNDIEAYHQFSNNLKNNQCVRIDGTAVLDMGANSCNSYKCPPCFLVHKATAVKLTIENCGSITGSSELFIANINMDGRTPVVISDGEVDDTPDRIVYSGESLYCLCNSLNNRLSCAGYSNCHFSLPSDQTCREFMPGCRVKYANQLGPNVDGGEVDALANMLTNGRRGS
eukprot:gnl/MRDRNA2_/MRDRNA2_31008_c0_seq1.p1 gnl/MRDRNA2_/MRDRNA2_31008_c0~~gnl/MRDRNA2_/MRDRNA2_31008_c0_seq1.p1  ORF type:complete len:272 (+),score=17.22 gnl/MRDRNA2_/MRDRNA2_31008_c0_seq1:111-818(+)